MRYLIPWKKRLSAQGILDRMAPRNPKLRRSFSMNTQEGPSWGEMLSKCLVDIRRRYPRLNDTQIADKLSIPRATFNRIKNEQKLPRLDNLIKVIVGSGNTEILSEAITLLDHGPGKTLGEVLSVALEEDNKVLADSDLESLLNNRDVFVSYLLADMPKGTDKIQLVEVLGNLGLEAIKVLIEKGIVVETNKRYLVKDQGILVRSFSSIKHHLNTYSKFYKTGHVGKGRNYVHSLSDGLNPSGIKKIQDAHRAFHEELKRIYRDESNRGDIPSFSVAFCDTLTSIEPESARLDKEVLQ